MYAMNMARTAGK